MVIVGVTMIFSGMTAHLFLVESPRNSLIVGNYDVAISVKIRFLKIILIFRQ